MRNIRIKCDVRSELLLFAVIELWYFVALSFITSIELNREGSVKR